MKTIAVTAATGVRYRRIETQLLLAGVHPKVAQERLGHSTISTTMDLYSHVTNTMQGDAAAKLDMAFRSAINAAIRTK